MAAEIREAVRRGSYPRPLGAEHRAVTCKDWRERCGKPYVLSAHGMLEPWALAEQADGRSLMYAALFEHANVRGCCLPARPDTGTRRRTYRDFGAKGPIAVIPNAVWICQRNLRSGTVPAAVPGAAREAASGAVSWAAFTTKKGLDLLDPDAWTAGSEGGGRRHTWCWPGLTLEGTRAKVIGALIARVWVQGGQVSVYRDAGQRQDEVECAGGGGVFCAALLRSEGLSTAVLEAMGAGLPVIVTRARAMYRRWGSLRNRMADGESNGRRAERSRLGSFLATDGSGELSRAMGDAGQDADSPSGYGWTSVARARWREVYRWVSGRYGTNLDVDLLQ